MSSWLPVVMIGSVCSVRRSDLKNCSSGWMWWSEVDVCKDTGDGLEIQRKKTGCFFHPANHGINYQPQLGAGVQPSTVLLSHSFTCFSWKSGGKGDSNLRNDRNFRFEMLNLGSAVNMLMMKNRARQIWMFFSRQMRDENMTALLGQRKTSRYGVSYKVGPY